ncbi:MAG TPA: hypothetical protein VMZ33_03890, partial [Candidatus Limnocylindrales bacterium]|nr:hypothetical protein [Candidatus Limnocylindrales bacterium]
MDVRAVVRIFAGASLALLMAGQALGKGGDRVYIMPTTGVVDSIMQSYIREGLNKAEREGAAAVLIQLNTPGGALDATREIVTSLLNAPLPVIVWVGPDGSRAASAGTFITMAAHVAVMSPNSTIGAATPISGDGSDIPDDLKAKVLEDTNALLRSIAQARERSYDWALTTVVDARSYTGVEAVEQHGVDGTASTLQEAIDFAHGRTVTVGGQPTTLDLAGATTTDLSMNPLQALLHLLSDPNIAFILFTIGFYGLLFELQNPNWVTGILGGISIILAFIGFGSLPLNVGGLLLVALAAVLLILEVNVTSHGLLTVGALICFALGAGALYTEPGTPTAPDVSVALPVIVTMTALTGIFGVLIAIA